MRLSKRLLFRMRNVSHGAVFWMAALPEPEQPADGPFVWEDRARTGRAIGFCKGH